MRTTKESRDNCREHATSAMTSGGFDLSARYIVDLLDDLDEALASAERERSELLAWKASFYEMEALVEYSSKWINDSTRWEDDEHLAEKWQDLRNRAGVASPAEPSKPGGGE